MKRLSAFLVLPFSVLSYADEAAYCKQVLQGSAFNYMLESTCGFSAKVADKLDKHYSAKKCNRFFSDKEKSSLVLEAVQDGQMRLKVYGQSVFCEENMKAYSELIDYDLNQ